MALYERKTPTTHHNPFYISVYRMCLIHDEISALQAGTPGLYDWEFLPALERIVNDCTIYKSITHKDCFQVLKDLETYNQGNLEQQHMQRQGFLSRLHAEVRLCFQTDRMGSDDEGIVLLRAIEKITTIMFLTDSAVAHEIEMKQRESQEE